MSKNTAKTPGVVDFIQNYRNTDEPSNPNTRFRKIGPDDYGWCVRTLDQMCLMIVKHPASTLGTMREDVEQLARILDRLD